MPKAIEAEIKRRKSLSYTREFVSNEDGSWFARVLEFAGCMTQASTQIEAITMLDEAIDLWLRAKLEDGDAIPEPIVASGYSGKFLVRTPRSLHRDIVRRAESEGVSLNAWVTATLARSVKE